MADMTDWLVRDPELAKFLKKHEDPREIHDYMTKCIVGDAFTKSQRTTVKTITFLLPEYVTPERVAAMTKIYPTEAQTQIANYFRRFPKLQPEG